MPAAGFTNTIEGYTIFKGNKFGERQTASAEAKRAILAKFQSRPAADDPDVQARAAERKAIPCVSVVGFSEAAAFVTVTVPYLAAAT